MADSINWGQLAPLNQMAPIHTAAPGAGSAPTGGMLDPYAAQKLAIERQRLGLEQETTESNLKTQELNRQSISQDISQKGQKFPGELQNQTLVNQGQGLLNQKAQSELATQQYAIKVRQETSAAYEAAKNKGGPIGGLNAAYDKAAELGDVDTAAKGYQTVLDLQSKIKENRISDVLDQGNAAHSVMTASQKYNLTPLQAYTNMYKKLSDQNPDLPNPSSFRDNGQFEDTFIHPSLATALPYQQAAAAKQAADTGTALSKAQEDIQQRQMDLKDAVKNYGQGSQEAKDAATQLQNAQQNAIRVSRGGETGNIAGTASWLNSPSQNSVPDLIKQNSAMPGTNAPIPAGSSPSLSGQSNSALPPGVTAQDIAEELARRNPTPGK